MMLRAAQLATLRTAALLVPAPDRDEWFAEWSAELHYVHRGATRFCFGSFRDAIWIRRNCPRERQTPVFDSPLRCLLVLAALAGLAIVLAVLFGNVGPALTLPGEDSFSVGLAEIYLLSLVVLFTLNPFQLGGYPLNRYAPSVLIRVRRWAFLAAKIILIVLAVLFFTIAAMSIFPGSACIMLFGWIVGFRWALTDQRQRCPVCLRLLSHPTEIGSPAQMLFGWFGTELLCARGHGFLYVPGTITSWSGSQRWHYLGPDWATLR